MNASELRIGNYISYSGETHIVRGTAEIGNAIYLRSIVFPCASIEPIPITEEWFNKFGALKFNQPSEWEWEVPISAIKIKFRKSSSIWYSELGGIYLGDKIQCVHQLQNLFYDLTGQKLTIPK